MNRFFALASITFNHFIKKILINIILIFLLCTCVLYSNFAICEIKSIAKNYDIVTSINHKNTLLYMVSTSLTMAKDEYVLDVSELQGLQSVGYMRYSSIKEDTQNCKLYIYSKAVVQHVEIPLSKGTWDASVKMDGDAVYYPIVISQETSRLNYNDTTVIQLNSGERLKVYVCGVLDDDQKYINLSMATNAVNADHLVKDCTPQSVSYFAIEELYPAALKEGSHVGSAKFFFFDDTSSNVMNENYRILRNQGYTYTMDTLINNSQEQLKQGYTFYLPLLICLIILSVIGSISFTVLAIKDNQVYYSCFLLCGAQKGDCKNLSILNTLWIAALSLVTTIFLTSAFIRMGVFAGWYKLSIINVLASFMIYALFWGISVVITKVLFKNKTITQLLKIET